MERVVECVPNFSEGRRQSVIGDITRTIESVAGIRLLDVDPGANTHRTVVTFVGSPEAVSEAAFQAVKRASEVIDMREHHGEHPRMGATDVLPFVPVAGVTMDDCVQISRQVGRRIGEELGIPIYLYESAATRPERTNLAKVRAGEYEGLPEKLKDPNWQPDFGPAQFNARSGATAVGAREFLIAYNVNLNCSDRAYANEIANELRERGRWKRVGMAGPFNYKGKVVNFPDDGTQPCGICDYVGADFADLARHFQESHGRDLAAYYEVVGIDPLHPTGPVYTPGRFQHVKGMGWVIEDYQRAQVSMNMTNYHVSPPELIYEAAREEAARRGIVVTGSEVVGLMPFEAIRRAGCFYRKRMLKSTGIPVPDLVETAVLSMGLRDVAPFVAEEKILGLPRMDGPLVNRKVFDFVDEVSRETPAPGGGSVAALAGALGGALASMVGNLCVGKAEYSDRFEEICQVTERGQAVKDALLRGVDADTKAFDSVLTAMRLPKDTPEQRTERSAAIQAGYKVATEVPLETVKQCQAVLELCAQVVQWVDPKMVSDVGTGALMALAGAQAAGYNVRINLPSIKDQTLRQGLEAQLETALAASTQLASEVAAQVGRHFSAPGS